MAQNTNGHDVLCRRPIVVGADLSTVHGNRDIEVQEYHVPSVRLFKRTANGPYVVQVPHRFIPFWWVTAGELVDPVRMFVQIAPGVLLSVDEAQNQVLFWVPSKKRG